MLDRHEANVHEDNVRDDICTFLVEAGLAAHDDLVREANRIDIQSENLVIEVKRRIGRSRTVEPDPENVAQLDRYLEVARAAGKPERLGILTDGRHWVLRLPGIEEVRMTPPYAFTLTHAGSWDRLRAWLHAESQAIEWTNRPPVEGDIRSAFSAGPRFESGIAQLTELYDAYRDDPTVAVKRELWRRLLTAALGVVVEEEPDLDRLFIRHTYLSVVVGMAVQSAFGIDIRERAESDPLRLLDGSVFFSEVGIRGVIESDFFAWPAETGGGSWLASLATRVARFEWSDAEYDVVRILYQSVVPAGDRRRLGEYYTPDWLAEAVVREVVTDPLNQRVLDPSCGSGTFLRAAIRAFVEAARAQEYEPNRIVGLLREKVLGIDIHPVSVHLARATWLLAALDVVREAGREAQELTVPVYLGDSLQLRTDPAHLFAQETVTIEIEPPDDAPDEQPRQLRFPRALVEMGDWFDDFMLRVADAIERGHSPNTALDEAGIDKGGEREMLEETIATLETLHAEGRDHIWAYYTRNLVRPVWLASGGGKVDAIVGNPPWLTFNKTDATLRSELRRLSQSETYGIWAGRQYATHQDVAGLFFARCADLYLREGGDAAMVLPHSALQAGQYRPWRSGKWGLTEADLEARQPWDLERIEPNDFFPVPSCVVFARKVGRDGARALAPTASRWRGSQGGPFTYEPVPLAKDDADASPYGERARQGATIVPRVLFFVSVEPSDTALVPGIVNTSPVRSAQEKPPWKNLEAASLRNAPLEEEHVWPVHRGDTLAPFALLDPLHAVLPLRSGTELHGRLRSDSMGAIHGIEPTRMGERMRDRWATMSRLWNEHKSPNTKVDLLGQLDYMSKLTGQMERGPGYRLVYASSGRPTAAVTLSRGGIMDYTLFEIPCRTDAEAHYLAAVINSDALRDAVEPLMPKGQFGARHVQKHLWRLNIPEYDVENPLHADLAKAGAEAAREGTGRLEDMRGASGASPPVALVRRTLRQWLAISDLGQRMEHLTAELLSGGKWVSGFPTPRPGAWGSLPVSSRRYEHEG